MSLKKVNTTDKKTVILEDQTQRQQPYHMGNSNINNNNKVPNSQSNLPSPQFSSSLSSSSSSQFSNSFGNTSVTQELGSPDTSDSNEDNNANYYDDSNNNSFNGKDDDGYEINEYESNEHNQGDGESPLEMGHRRHKDGDGDQSKEKSVTVKDIVGKPGKQNILKDILKRYCCCCYFPCCAKTPDSGDRNDGDDNKKNNYSVKRDKRNKTCAMRWWSLIIKLLLSIFIAIFGAALVRSIIFLATGSYVYEIGKVVVKDVPCVGDFIMGLIITVMGWVTITVVEYLFKRWSTELVVELIAMSRADINEFGNIVIDLEPTY